MKEGYGKKTVLVFGVFDILHLGHLSFFERARRQGSELVVVVARDARVAAEKGRAPVFSESERLKMVKALRIVDRAILGDPPGKCGMLKKLKPDIVVLGHDQKVPPGALGQCKFVKASAKLRARWSSTAIRKALSGKAT
jgi:FAD synthetase